MGYSFDQYRLEFGAYEIPEKDGMKLYYPDVEAAITRDLGWCGCGDPTAALKYLHTGLEACRLYWAKEVSFEDRYKMFHSDGEMYFFLYWADAKELMEHGGSVGGSWLTEKGKVLLSDIDNYFKEIDNDN